MISQVAALGGLANVEDVKATWAAAQQTISRNGNSGAILMAHFVHFSFSDVRFMSSPVARLSVHIAWRIILES